MSDEVGMWDDHGDGALGHSRPAVCVLRSFVFGGKVALSSNAVEIFASSWSDFKK